MDFLESLSLKMYGDAGKVRVRVLSLLAHQLVFQSH
jgi:hypothetical protein